VFIVKFPIDDFTETHMTLKTAFITGASVGIGRETAIVLANASYNLVLLARR